MVKYLRTTKKKKKKKGKKEPVPSKTSQGTVSLKIEKSSLVGENIAVIFTIMTHRVNMQY